MVGLEDDPDSDTVEIEEGESLEDIKAVWGLESSNLT